MDGDDGEEDTGAGMAGRSGSLLLGRAGDVG